MSRTDFPASQESSAVGVSVPAVGGSLELLRAAQTVSPERLVMLLSGCGWEIAGRRAGVYVRLRGGAGANSFGTSVIVPLNPSASDYGLLMKAAVETVSSSSPETWRRSIEPLLGLTAADTFDFRKETSAPRGLIAWNDGSELIDSARRTLIAGAKAHRGPSRHFSNRHGRFASRYLDQVFMGQSEVGSYIVTAFAPTEASVPIRGTPEGTLGLGGVDTVRSRDVTLSVVVALEAASEAVDYYRSSGSMAGFSEQVDRGVSYELVTALRDITSGADQSDITVKLAPTDQPQTGEPPPEPETRCFEFSGGDTGVLERAANQLSAPDKTERVVVEGRVHLLTKKEAGGPGVFGVDDGRRRYRVRLDSQQQQQYHEAVIAHDEDRSIVVEGDLSREGSLRWLYSARLRATAPLPTGTTAAAPPPTAPLPGQMQIGTTTTPRTANPPNS